MRSSIIQLNENESLLFTYVSQGMAYEKTYNIGGSVSKTINHYINVSLLNPHWVREHAL